MTSNAARPIVTVIYSEVTAPVVRAQTPPLLAAWRAAGRRTDCAVFATPRALVFPSVKRDHETACAAIARATGVPVMRRTHMPRDKGLPALGNALGRDLRERKLLDAVLLCRQPRAAIVGAAAKAALGDDGKDLRVVLDLRGIRDEEYLLTLGKTEAECEEAEREKTEQYRSQEGEACRAADAVLTVSNPMQRYVAQRWGLADARLGHVPNHTGLVDGAEDLRAATRRELGIDDRTLLVIYSGTMAAWQLPDRSAQLVRALQVHRPDVRLLFLTPEPDAAHEAIKLVALENALVRSAPSSEVARWLCAADYGLLLRQDSPVNRVACPVKFGEYLACGVRPIVTPNIGDQSRLCLETDLGVVVSLADAALAAKQVAIDCARPNSVDLAGRTKRRTWAHDHISPERVAARIAEFLDRL